MNYKLTCFLVALASVNSAFAHDCSDKNHLNANDKEIEISGNKIRTQNLLRSLVKRGAILYDEDKKMIRLDITKLTSFEVQMYIKSQETLVDMEDSTISFKPEFSTSIIKQELLKIEELNPSNLTNDEIMEELLLKVSPEIRDDIQNFKDHSFA